MGRRKAAAPVEEQPKEQAQEALQTTQEAQADREQSQAAQTDQETQQDAREQSQAVQTAPEAPRDTQEQSPAVQTAPEAPQTARAAQEAPQTTQKAKGQALAVQVTQEAPDGVQPGIDLEDTALAGISDDIMVVNAKGGLNLRIGPGRSYPVAELLEDGTLLAVLELPHGAEVPGWALVHTGQRTGWVDCSFIQELEEAKEE